MIVVDRLDTEAVDHPPHDIADLLPLGIAKNAMIVIRGVRLPRDMGEIATTVTIAIKFKLGSSSAYYNVC